MTIVITLGMITLALLNLGLLFYLFIWIPTKIGELQREILYLKDNQRENRDDIIKLKYTEKK